MADVTDRPDSWGLTPEVYQRFFGASPAAFVVIRADGLVMVDANEPYLEQVGKPLEELVGRNVFEVFPNSPDNEDYDQATDLEYLMTTAVREKRTTTVEAMRYDIPVEGGGFDVRWWNAMEIPIFDDDGEVTHLLHYSEDVTELSRTRDVLAETERARTVATRRVTTQAELALALTSAQTVEDLEQIIVVDGLSALGAEGGGLLTRADDGGWRVTASETLGDHVQSVYGWFAYDDPFPAPVSARRGERILLPSREEFLAYHPGMVQVAEVTGRAAWAFLPLVAGNRRLGTLGVAWAEDHPLTDDELDLLDGVAAQCALALDRIEQADALRRTAAQMQELAESLQSSLMSPPPLVPGLDIAVRYRSADDVAQVGGDWYDAFVQPNGDLTVIIGDVIGHDHVAAGKMGQLRGLLRALAYDAEDRPHAESPAAVISRFERVGEAQGVGDLATVILARLERAPDGPGRRVTWSNAGNPPPIVLHADGHTVVLETEPDPMVGAASGLPRADHQIDLADDDTLLLFTDGLIERRTTSIEAGIADLRESLTDLARLSCETLCQTVLVRLATQIGEDDVAVLAVRGSND